MNVEDTWLDRARREDPEMSEAELRFFCDLKRRNREHVRIFNQKCRAFRRLVTLARKGNEYAAQVLRDLPRWR